MQLWFRGNKIENIVTLAILVRTSTMTTILKFYGNIVSTGIDLATISELFQKIFILQYAWSS
jgi:hypothetical protein